MNKEAPSFSTRVPVARLELYSDTHQPITDELDATSKALLVEFSWSDLSPPPLSGHKTVYTLDWDAKPIVLPRLEDQSWEWDAPIEVPSEIVYDGTKEIVEGAEEETVMVLVLLQGIEPHMPKVYLRQKHDAIAPAAALDDDAAVPLEIPVKTLSPTYPLSSEFLGANYRYIADLIMREVATAPEDAAAKGILHTVFATKRLEEIEIQIQNGKESRVLLEEKTWLQSYFGITLERLKLETANDNTNDAPKTRLMRSPTATSKEWTSQLDLAKIDVSASHVDDPPAPWSASTLPDTPIKPSIRPVRPSSIPSTPASAISGLGFSHDFPNTTGEEITPVAESEGEEEEEDDLFQLPLSPRTTNTPHNPFMDSDDVDMPAKRVVAMGST